MTTGMITSFSLPGLPSALSLRMAFASCELCAVTRVVKPTAVKPRAEKREPNRIANVLRVETKFIFMLLSACDLKFVVRKEATRSKSRSSSCLRPECNNFLRLQAADFLHRLHNRFPLLDERVHRVLFIIHLLRQCKYCLCLNSWNDGDPITIGDHDIAGVYRHCRDSGHKNSCFRKSMK